MAQAKILKRRIKSAKNISQITRAMQMVAAAKMKKAQDAALVNRNYAEKLLEMTGKLIPYMEKNKSAALRELYLVITPNKGLCGSLNTFLTKKILEIIKEKRDMADFVLLGKKGEAAVAKYSGQVKAAFVYGLTQPKYEVIVPITKLILEDYKLGKYAKVFVLYTDYVNTLVQRPRVLQILPVLKEEATIENEIEYIFEPSKEHLIRELIPYYVKNQLFQLLLESYASEQSARMIAMKNATDNAKEIMKELTLVYNRERQTQITNEIADIATAQLVI